MSGDNPDIHIALATFNGAQYLTDQLTSIHQQTYTNWFLHVADDGSTDGTLVVIHAFATAHPGQVTVENLGNPVRSPAANFLRLLAALPSNCAYVALCDQDDRWKPNKLEQLLAASKPARIHAETPTPILAFSDLAVTDQSLNLTSPSFMRDMSVHPDKLTFGNLLVENSIPGCTMLLDNALLRLVQRTRYSTQILMHDWWIALIAAGCGHIAYVPQALVDYRQHSANTAGSVKRSDPRFMVRKAAELRTRTFDDAFGQARLLARTFEHDLTPTCANAAREFGALDHRRKPAKIWTCLKHGIVKQRFDRQIQQMLAI